MNIARYEKRVFGWMIDEFISLLVGAALFVGFLAWFGPSFPSYFNVLLSLLGAYLFYAIAVSLFLWISNGHTLGGVFFGIKSWHPDGRRFSLRNALLKALLTGMVAMVLPNALFMLFTHTERSVFDRLSNTLVIDERHP